MAADPWADYLAALSEHLRVSRRAVEEGAVVPPPPPQPSVPMPGELGDQAHRLAIAYDQLALEVTTRLDDIGAHLPGVRAGTLPRPQFVDRKA